MPEGGDWIQVYDLARDREYVERVQKGTIEGGEFALDREHGLLGSRRWWDAVASGAIPTLTLDGVVTRVYVSASNWPEFEVEAGGDRTTWALEGEAARYAAGKRVRVRYLMHRTANPAPGSGGEEVRIVIGIWLAP